MLLTLRIFACRKDFSPLPCTRGRGVGGEGVPSGEDSPLTPTLSPEYRGEGEFGCGSAALGCPCNPWFIVLGALSQHTSRAPVLFHFRLRRLRNFAPPAFPARASIKTPLQVDAQEAKLVGP